MDGSNRVPGRRTLTPAVVGAAVFAAACAVFAIAFVSARGGLQLPNAGSPPPVAVASPLDTSGASVVPSPIASAAATLEPSGAPTATIEPSPSPIVLPPSAAPTSAAPSLSPDDPLLALPGCPGLPGCFEYTVRRNDTLSGIASRYVIPVSTVRALNPQITDQNVVVVGELLYLGHDPFVRLPSCPGVANCSLYTVQPGDRLSTIAGRFGITTEAILAANPQITDPNLISSGQVIKLPHPTA